MKLAVTAGALVGGTVAIMNNKQKVFETAEVFFEAAAQFCKEQQQRMKQANMAFADSHADGSFRQQPSEPLSGFSSGVSTPEGSDEEEDEDEDYDDYYENYELD